MTRFLLLSMSMLVLPACSPGISAKTATTVSRQDQLACEQEALLAKSSYVARIKTPEYDSSSQSTTWRGGARTDSGEWVFNDAFKTCMQHAGGSQP